VIQTLPCPRKNPPKKENPGKWPGFPIRNLDQSVDADDLARVQVTIFGISGNKNGLRDPLIWKGHYDGLNEARNMD
jgi:hypothetical protein